MEARRRWRAVAAAAAVAAIGSATVGVVRSAARSEHTSSVFVPIVPCRLLDTRSGPDNVGERATPLGPDERATVAVWGANGRCSIPTEATGITANLTAVNASTDTFLTLYPADTELPGSSNLNPKAGGAPVANAVTVKVSSDGRIGVYNQSGAVDIVLDIVGYYSASLGGPPGPIGPAGGARYGRTIVSKTTVTTGTADFTSIVLGADGNPVISYFDQANQSLNVAACANATCTTSTRTTVDTGGVGQFSSITLGNDGNPVISYWDSPNGALKFARCTNPTCTASTTTTVDTGGLGRSTSIAIVTASPIAPPTFSK